MNRWEVVTDLGGRSVTDTVEADWCTVHASGVLAFLEGPEGVSQVVVAAYSPDVWLRVGRVKEVPSEAPSSCAVLTPYDGTPSDRGWQHSRCAAHGEKQCPSCSRPGGAGPDGCDQCSTYGAYGWHWDTCPNRDKSPLTNTHT